MTSRPAKRLAKRLAKRPVKLPAVIAGPSQNDLEMQKVKLLTGARANMLQHEYDRANKQLQALIKLEPKNTNLKMMLERLRTVIKTRAEEAQ